MSASHEEKFLKTIETLISQKRSNSIFFTQEKTNLITQRLLYFDDLAVKTSEDYYWKKAYEVFQCDGDNVLRRKGTHRQVIPIEQLYEVLQFAHLTTSHGGRDAMHKHLSPSFYNVTTELCSLYISLCERCQHKKNRKIQSREKSIVTDPTSSSELNSRCQVDLIDQQSQPDGPYRFILSYQDHLTKFIRLKPLKTDTAVETAENVLEIFCDMGAPHILQSDNGREFAKKIVQEITKMWSMCRIVHGKSSQSQSQGSVESALDIQNKLDCWLKDNKTTHWAKGLKFIQFSKNASYHDEIKKTPYEAMFGCPPKLGIFNSKLPSTILQKIHTEEEYETLVENREEEIL